MKYFSATIAAVTAIQVSSKSLANQPDDAIEGTISIDGEDIDWEVGMPESNAIVGTFGVDGADLDWELNWDVSYGDEDYSDEEPSGPTMLGVEAGGNSWQIATVDTCEPSGFELCKVKNPQEGLYIADYALAKANEGTIIPKTETWGWYGVYGGFCEGRGYTGSCRALSADKDPMHRLTGNAVCVRC